MSGKCCVGLNLISRRLRREGWEETNCNFHRGSFQVHTSQASHFLGPPLHFSLPYSSLKHQENHPHPFGKGRGGCGLSLLLRWVVGFEFDPTSLKRGEGLFDKWLWVIESEMGECGGGGMGVG